MKSVKKLNKILMILGLLSLVACSPKKKSETQQISYSSSTVSVSSPAIFGGESTTVLVNLLDTAGSPYLIEGSILLGLSGGSSTGTFSAVSYVGNGVYSATFTGATAGTSVYISALFNGEQITSVAPSIQVNVGSLSLTHSLVSIGTSSLVSGQTTPVSLVLTDAGGNALISSGHTIVFTLSGGSSTGSFDAVVENLDGSYSTNLTGDLAGTAVQVLATVDGQPITGEAPSLSVIPGNFSLVMSSVTGPTSGTIGVPVTLTLTLKDGAGNLNPSGTVSTVGLVRVFTGGNGTFGSAVSLGGGVYQVELTPTVAGGFGILGQINGNNTGVAYGLWFTANP